MVTQKGYFQTKMSGSACAVRQLANVGGIFRLSAAKNGIERQRARACYCAVIVGAMSGQGRDPSAFCGEEWY